MKRVLFICLAVLGLVFYSCNNSAPSSRNESVTEDDFDTDYPPELIEWANRFHFNIDTTKVYDLDIKAFQCLDDNACLAHEKMDKGYDLYYGQLLYYMSSDMVYDGKIIKEKAYLLGTYHYVSQDSTRRVVPFYCNTEIYKKYDFDLIKEIQNY